MVHELAAAVSILSQASIAVPLYLSLLKKRMTQEWPGSGMFQKVHDKKCCEHVRTIDILQRKLRMHDAKISILLGLLPSTDAHGWLITTA